MSDDTKKVLFVLGAVFGPLVSFLTFFGFYFDDWIPLITVVGFSLWLAFVGLIVWMAERIFK